MLKNSIVLIFLSLLNIALYAQSEVLTIYKKNGTSEQHLFIDHPKIYHHGDNLLMKTDNVIVSYPFDSISKYTVNESNETLILKRITIDNDKLQEYINENDIDDCDITYIRTFEDTLWQSFYVPFEVELSALSEEFEFALINNFHQYDDNNDGYFDRIELEIKRCDLTKTLQANYPYLIRAKELGTKKIRINPTSLYATEEYSIDCSSVEFTYTFTGSYKTITNLRQQGCYYLEGGYLTKSYTSSQELPPFRWTMSIDARNSQYKDSPIIVEPKKIRIRIWGENNTTNIENTETATFSEEIYNLSGKRVQTTNRQGVYIMKMSDGSYKKVFIK